MRISQKHHFLASNPPHAESLNLPEIAAILGEAVAETGLRVRFPAPQIWKQSPNRAELEAVLVRLTNAGLSMAIVSAEELFSIPAAHRVHSIVFEEDRLLFEAPTVTHVIALQSPILFTELKMKAFGAEYRQFRDKERARKDKKKRKDLRDNHAFLASTAEESHMSTSNKNSLTWIFAQQTDTGLIRLSLTPSSLTFDMLEDDKAINSAHNIEQLRSKIIHRSDSITHQAGLIDVSYRYPQLQAPAFVQLIEQAGLQRDTFSPAILAEHLSTAVWCTRV